MNAIFQSGVLTLTLLALIGASRADAAPILVSFEDLPEANLLLGDGVNVGSFYPGLTFGPDVTGLSASRFGYNDLGYPAHSGDTVIVSAAFDSLSIDFAQPILSFGVWYTSFNSLLLSFFDAANTLLGTETGPPNTDGVFGTSDFIQFAAAGIRRVTVDGEAGSFVLDDLTYDMGGATPPGDPVPVPEPSTLLLAVSGLSTALTTRRRRRNRTGSSADRPCAKAA